MAHRRCLGALLRPCRPCRPLLSPSIQRTLTLEIATPTSIRSALPPSQWIHPLRSDHPRNLSSRRKNPDDDDDQYQYQLSGDEDEDDDDDDDEEEEEEEEVEDGGAPGMRRAVQSGKKEEEKLKEAAEIGYVVTGALERSEKPFKLWEPVYAVVQLGSHQFKVSNGDSIFTERLKYCDVNDKLILNKVLMLGSRSQTIIGRPILPDAAVHAVVEEHALDAKVIIFKKKRRKNYRRTRGHRQELTKLRITDIQGIDKTEVTAVAA